MTDLTTWPASLHIAFLLAPFLIGLIGLGIHYHIAGSRHFEVLCSAFQNSPGLIEDLRYWSTISIRTRAMIVAGVTLAAVCPSLVVRRLQISFWCTAIAGFWIMAGWVLIEFDKL